MKITFEYTSIEIEIEDVGPDRYRVWIKPHADDVFMDEWTGNMGEVQSFVAGFQRGATYWSAAVEKINAAEET